MHLKSPAKINMFLHVMGKRPDGYHLLESLMMPVDLHDEITIKAANAHKVRAEGTFAQAVGDDNIMTQAIKAFEAATHIEVEPLDIVINKKIPVGGGLGGGSSNAATMLLYLRQHYATKMNDSELIDIAVKVGADVPFFIQSNAALVSGIGEVIAPVSGLPSIPAILINPYIFISTASIFTKGFSTYNAASITVEDIPKNISSLLAFLKQCRNDLTYNALKEEPQLAEIFTVLRKLPGCQLAQMSGSGATCFALFASPEERDKAIRKLEKKAKQWWIQPTLINFNES